VLKLNLRSRFNDDLGIFALKFNFELDNGVESLKTSVNKDLKDSYAGIKYDQELLINGDSNIEETLIN
jgi:hypothetical protein